MIQEHTKQVKTYNEFKKLLDGNWIIAPWCGENKCEEKIKNETGAKITNIPFDLNEKKPKENCIVCGKPAKYMVYLAKSY